jgi:hypothetical protein
MRRTSAILLYILAALTVIAVPASLTTCTIETHAYLHSTPQLATAQTVPLWACLPRGGACRTAYVTAAAARVNNIAKLVSEVSIVAIVSCFAVMIPVGIKAKRLK